MLRPPFPKTLAEFQRQFADEAACRAYLALSRWPESYRCPACRHAAAFELPRRHLWQCKSCGHQTSVTAGTILHRSKLPLTQWFWAAYLMATHTPGLSALQLQRQLGGRYETAWVLLHKLRSAMVRLNREALFGIVEVDETYVGGPEEGLRGGRQRGRKAIVVGAVEVRGTAAGRVRLQVIPNVSGPTLTGFVKAQVAPGTIVLTDGWSSYEGLAALGYAHQPRTQGNPAKRADTLLPHVHRVFSNLKTWLRGTHHGVRPKHLQGYLDEFTFRFNRRRTPMAAFQSLLGLGAQHGPTPYTVVYGSESTG